VFRPAVTQFGSDTAEVVGTPAVDSTAGYDAYLTVGSSGIAAGTRQPLEIDIVVQPLVMWLWVGGGVLAFGALLAGFPERRRRRPRPPAAVTPLAGRRGELVAAQR
jgi:cytochrome c-type biogenesis protein CcmF